jgi:type VI secretion system secreted protein Hcp
MPQSAKHSHADHLLVIDGIKGESEDSKHPGAIEVHDFAWGNVNCGSAATGGGAGAGKVQFKDLKFHMRVNIASPLLALACANGRHFPKGQFFVRKQGAHQQDYYVISLEDFIVSGFDSGGSDRADGLPEDTFTLNFARFKFEYKRQRPDGTLEAPITMGWDVKQNKQL